MYTKPYKTVVVRPQTMTPKDYKMSVRRQVFLRDEFTCQDCGKKFEQPKTYSGRYGIKGLTLGHIIPRCLRGHFTPDNLSAQCEECNDKLGNQIWQKMLRVRLTNYNLK